MFSPTTFIRGGAALALLGSLSLTACDSGEPDGGAGEQELISQVTLSLTPDGGGAARTITVDFDAAGTNPTYSPARLDLVPGVTYTGTVQLRDAFNDVDVTAEVEDEAEEHLLRYAFQPASAGTVVATDTESDYTAKNENGGDFAVGLAFRAAVADDASGEGTLEAVLYHFDDAPKTSSTATSDEIDVLVAFPVRFQAVASN